MRRSLARRAAAHALAACAAWAWPALAHAQIEPIRLTYAAPDGCPTEAEFLESVVARTGRARRATGDERARAFEVDVSGSGDVHRGLLRIASPDGSVTRREVNGQSCADVVTALALVMALAIDPGASLAPAPAPTPMPTPAPTPTPAPEDAVDSPPGPPTRPLHWGLGVDGQTIAGFAPQPSIGAGAFVDLARDGGGLFTPSFRASLLAASTNASFAPGVGADLVWAFARLEICPLRLAPGEALVLGLCGAVDAGVLYSHGSGLPKVASETRRWISPGLLARVAWSLPRHFWTELGAGVSFPLDRYVFYYGQSGPQAGGDTQVSQVPAAGAVFAMGLGYHFP